MVELATVAASELAENLAEELGVRLVKPEASMAASVAMAFLTTEALKVSLIGFQIVSKSRVWEKFLIWGTKFLLRRNFTTKSSSK